MPQSRTGWIIHLQADEKRAGKVRSAEVEWPWFLLAAGHPAVAVVIIHTSQMAFPWASMKRTGQGLSCQVLPGPKTSVGLCGTWRERWACRKTWRWGGLVKPGGNAVLSAAFSSHQLKLPSYIRHANYCIELTLACSEKGFAMTPSKPTVKTRLRLCLSGTSENLGSHLRWLALIIPLLFLAMSQRCAQTAK